MQASKKDQIRAAAEADLVTFIELVHPMRVLGQCHKELIRWWNRSDSKNHQLVLLPRDHGKSAMVAYRVAWEITRNPAVRILYISSTTTLAAKQLKFIKDILTSKIYRRYWPEMVNEEESKREKWTEGEFSIDHPVRKEEAIRDATVFAAGLTTTITGLHCDVAVMDDVVVRENAYTQEGRDKVESQYSLLASIQGADAQTWVVGTRYDPNDLYGTLLTRQVELYDENGDLASAEPLYEVHEKQVEDVGDMTGEYLWPKQQRYDGKWFGFDQNVLATKRAQYIDQTQFRAQYYNNPNDEASAGIKREYFQYFKRQKLSNEQGEWYYSGRKLNVFAAIDFAFSITKRADYSSIVVVGVDWQNNYYVLDIKRFKTDRIKDYFENILEAHQKWNFHKLRAEVTSGQAVIVKDLKENYITRYGLALSIDDYSPSMHDGRKEERIQAALQPRYENMQMWHYEGGNIQTLEEELVQQRPPHDDVKDALAACVDICKPPSRMLHAGPNAMREKREMHSHTRFGGIS